MKTTQFIKWQIRKYLPICIALFIICAAISWLTAINNSIAHSIAHNYYGNPYYNFYSMIFDLFGLGIMLSLILPFFVFDYRSNKLAADAFRQFPAKKNQIRNIRLTIAYIALIVIFTVTFFGAVLIYYIRYCGTQPSYEVFGTTFVRHNINFTGYFTAYLILILIVSLNYFTNSFLVSLGQNAVTSSIFLIAGLIILNFGLLTIPLWLNTSIGFGQVPDWISNPTWALTGSFSEVEVLSYFDNIIRNHSFDVQSSCITIFVITSLIRAGLGVLTYLLPEPSGEYYGAPSTNKLWKRIIIYVSYGIAIIILDCLFLTSGSMFFIYFIILILAFVYFYLQTAIFNKRFKINKEEGIVFLVLFITFVVFLMIGFLIKKLPEPSF